MNIFKLNFEIFKKQFKINNYLKLLSFFSSILFCLIIFHIPFIFLGKYEDMYILKSLIFFTISIEFIFPKNNMDKKIKLKAFFDKFKNTEIENYYLLKNFFLVSILGIFLFLPYTTYLINLSLLYISILFFIFMITIILKKIFFKVDILSYLSIIRGILTLFFIIFVKKETGMNLKYFANEINFIFFILLSSIFILISIKTLKKLNTIYIKKHNFSRNLLNYEKYFSYNFLYIIRNGIFIKNISLFYLVSILIIYKEDIETAVLSFAISIIFNNLLTLFTTFKLEKNKINFLYDRNLTIHIKNLKILDNIKLYLLYIILILPIIYIKIGYILSLKLVILTTIITIISTIIITSFLYKKNYIYNKNNIIISLLINIIFIIIGINM